jgi:hypothetical protein
MDRANVGHGALVGLPSMKISTILQIHFAETGDKVTLELSGVDSTQILCCYCGRTTDLKKALNADEVVHMCNAHNNHVKLCGQAR